MTKEQYMDLLRYYFRKAKKEDVQEILLDYEEHFFSGREKGLTEEQIIASLGDPKEIYEEYLSAGIVTERKGLLKGDLKEIVERAQDGFKENVEPKIPGIVNIASRLTLRVGRTGSYLLAITSWALTGLILYLLLIQWHPVPEVAALPPIHMATLGLFTLGGFSLGLMFIFIAAECKKWLAPYDVIEGKEDK